MGKTKQTIADIDETATLIDEYEFIKTNELNALTLSSLIPANMPRMGDS